MCVLWLLLEVYLAVMAVCYSFGYTCFYKFSAVSSGRGWINAKADGCLSYILRGEVFGQVFVEGAFGSCQVNGMLEDVTVFFLVQAGENLGRVVHKGVHNGHGDAEVLVAANHGLLVFAEEWE